MEAAQMRYDEDEDEDADEDGYEVGDDEDDEEDGGIIEMGTKYLRRGSKGSLGSAGSR